MLTPDMFRIENEASLINAHYDHYVLQDALTFKRHLGPLPDTPRLLHAYITGHYDGYQRGVACDSD